MIQTTNLPARELLLRESYGVLSTISVDVPGYPFGSITPYCVDHASRPVIYTSFIAQHTRNFLANTRASLIVVDAGDSRADVQAQGRLTCIGDIRPVGKDEEYVAERYFRYFPSSRQYEQTHDFAFFRIELVRVRYIGGFGQIHWIDPADFLTDNPFSPSDEKRILDHMNRDHAGALRIYANSKTATMTGIDAFGFDMLTGAGQRARITFDNPIHTLEEARQALVALAKR